MARIRAQKADNSRWASHRNAVATHGWAARCGAGGGLRWLRNGVAVSGAKPATYKVRSADKGRTVTVREVCFQTRQAVLHPLIAGPKTNPAGRDDRRGFFIGHADELLRRVLPFPTCRHKALLVHQYTCWRRNV